MESTTKEQSANPDTDDESLSRRVADQLHERIDQAAQRGEKLEHSLHETCTKAHCEKCQEMAGSLTKLAKDNPWAIFGGSVALGILIGALVSRR